MTGGTGHQGAACATALSRVGQSAVLQTMAERAGTIVYIASEDWFVCSHFLPLIRQAQTLGLAVVVITRVRQHAGALEAEGCRVIAIEAERARMTPLSLLRNFIRLTAVLRKECPDIVHCIALRLVVLGGLAARLAGVRKLILAPVGLGHLWIATGWKIKIARTMTTWIVGRFLHTKDTTYLFENREDPLEFGLDVAAPNVAIVAGAGVDPVEYYASPEPCSPPLKVAVVARMTDGKGIVDSIAAAQRARQLGADIELNLYGAIDPSDHGALTADALHQLCRAGGAVWHGTTDDIPSVWRAHHVAMLLSRREGLPRSLIEASACARPIVATDVTGCREVVVDEITGLLVPLGDVGAAAIALVRLANNAELRLRLGTAAEHRFKANFSELIVKNQIDAVYRKILRPTD